MSAVRHLVGHVADGVVGGRGADARDAVLGEPAGAREPGVRQAALAEHGGEARVIGRALLVLGDVFLARPDHFHGPLELLRELGRLAGDGGQGPPRILTIPAVCPMSDAANVRKSISAQGS